MTRKQINLFLFAMALSMGAVAQEKLSLNLDQAKTYALDFNKTIRNSGLAVDQSQDQLWEAIAAGLPQISATTDYTNSMGSKLSIQFAEGQPATEIPLKPTSNFQVQVTQLIFNGNYLVGVQTAKLYKQLSEKQLQKTEKDVISQVVDGYYLVLISKKSLGILNENLKNLQEIYKKTQPMVRVGMMEKVELDQLSVQVSSLKNSVRSAERNYEMAQNMLRLQLGVSADTELELTETLDNILNSANLNETLAIPFEVNQNIDYQLMNVQENMMEKQVNMQKANYLPSVSGYYSYTKKILKPAFDMSPPNVVGLQMNIPIFSSGERRSKVRQAKIDLETTRNNKELLEDQLGIQYKQLSFNLKSAIENFENQKENVKVSREVYEDQQRKYQHGIISGLELTTADNNYLNSESNYLSAMLEVLKAQNELQILINNEKNN